MIEWLNARAAFGDAPVLFYLLVTLIDTHITTACVTLYLHRSQTHGAVLFHPAVAHFMRAWLWLRTAMPTRDWVAVHRCHHAHVDTDRDPHSPIVYGIWRVVVFGTHLYHAAARNDEICEQYGKGTPSDWVERHIYQPFSLLGPCVTLITNVLLFGAAGIAMWLVEMAWTCGESLHNNHHHIQNSVRFSMRPGEIDLGYYYVRALQRLRLAAVRAR